MKRTVALALCVMVLLSVCTVVSAAEPLQLTVNGVDVPVNVNWYDKTLVPVRAAMEALGYEIGWNGTAREVRIKNADTEMILSINAKRAFQNGRTMEVPELVLKNNTTYIPVSFLAKQFDLTYSVEETTNRLYLWDGATAEAFITADYPIVIVPGTMGCWTSVDFDALKHHVKQDGENPLANAAMSLVRPALLSILDGIDALEESFESYYVTETNGKIYYVDPFWDTYAPLCAYLESHGLEQDKDYFIFGYDTLNISIEDNAKQLRLFVADILEETGAKKVQIIAHSQGGLVTRQYIQSYGGFRYVAKLLGVGVPNHGVSYVYPLCDKGSFNPLDGREMMISVLAYFSYGDFSAESKMRFVHENSKTLVQMLPTYFDTGDLENTFLLGLNDPENMEKLALIGEENILMLAGSGIQTIEGYEEIGKEIYGYDGDGTVLASSVRLDGAYRFGLLPETRHTDGFRAGSVFYRFLDLTEKEKQMENETGTTTENPEKE